MGAAATGAADAEAAAEEVDCSRCTETTEGRRLRRRVLCRPAPSVLPEVDAIEVEVVSGHRRQLQVSGARENAGRGGGDWRARVVRGVVDDVVVVDATDPEPVVAPTPPVPPPALARIAARGRPAGGGVASLLATGKRRTNSSLSLSSKNTSNERKVKREKKN